MEKNKNRRTFEFYKKNGLLNGDFYNHNLMEVVSLFLVMIYVHTMMTQ